MTFDAGIDFIAEIRWSDCSTSKIGFAFCSFAKSFAGREFHTEGVQSVIVYDAGGNVYLYLVSGCPDKTINVKSPDSLAHDKPRNRI